MKQILSFVFIFALGLSQVDSAFCCASEAVNHASHSESFTHVHADFHVDSSTKSESVSHCEVSCPCVHQFVSTQSLVVQVNISLMADHFSIYQFIYEQPFIGFEPLPPLQA